MMMAHWSLFEQRKPGVIRRRIRRGIPEPLRGQMWIALSQSGERKVRKDEEPSVPQRQHDTECKGR